MGTGRSSSEAEREAHISPRVMEYVRQRSTCSATFPRVLSFEWCSSRILKRSPYFCTLSGRRLVKQAGPGEWINPIPTAGAIFMPVVHISSTTSSPRTLFGSSGSYTYRRIFHRPTSTWRKSLWPSQSRRKGHPAASKSFFMHRLSAQSRSKKGGRFFFSSIQLYRIVIILPRNHRFLFF